MEFYFETLKCEPACKADEICLWGECVNNEDMLYYNGRNTDLNNKIAEIQGGYLYIWTESGVVVYGYGDWSARPTETGVYAICW